MGGEGGRGREVEGKEGDANERVGLIERPGDGKGRRPALSAQKIRTSDQ